jgi:type IV pilus assembly protein PilX
MNQLSHNSKQKGAALIVSLIILVAMTLLGITSMKGTSTELSMAGNLRESALSFQAAEAGLRNAESVVEASTSAASLTGSTGYIAEFDADPDYLTASSWSNARSIPDTDMDLAGIATNPKFFIKYALKWSNNKLDKGLNKGSGYGGQQPGETAYIFKITSRGSGQTGRSYRTVQSYYAKKY